MVFTADDPEPFDDHIASSIHHSPSTVVNTIDYVLDKYEITYAPDDPDRIYYYHCRPDLPIPEDFDEVFTITQWFELLDIGFFSPQSMPDYLSYYTPSDFEESVASTLFSHLFVFDDDGDYVLRGGRYDPKSPFYEK